LAAGFIALLGAGLAARRTGLAAARARGALFVAPPFRGAPFDGAAFARPRDGAPFLAAGAALRAGAAGFDFRAPLRTAATAFVTRRAVTFT